MAWVSLALSQDDPSDERHQDEEDDHREQPGAFGTRSVGISLRHRHPAYPDDVTFRSADPAPFRGSTTAQERIPQRSAGIPANQRDSTAASVLQHLDWTKRFGKRRDLLRCEVSSWCEQPRPSNDVLTDLVHADGDRRLGGHRSDRPSGVDRQDCRLDVDRATKEVFPDRTALRAVILSLVPQRFHVVDRAASGREQADEDGRGDGSVRSPLDCNGSDESSHHRDSMPVGCRRGMGLGPETGNRRDRGRDSK